MKTTTEFYPVVYYIENTEGLAENQMDNLLMCGNKNWNYYFYALEDDVDEEVEKIENVELIEFESEDDMFGFLKGLDDGLLLNFSTQHEKPCVLKFSNIS